MTGRNLCAVELTEVLGEQFGLACFVRPEMNSWTERIDTPEKD